MTLRYLRIVALQLRISAAAAMAYRANFLVQGALTLLETPLTLLPLLVLYSGRTTVAGWDAPSALIVMAYFMGVRAVLEGVITPSLVELIASLRSGAFDYVLLKPVDAQLLVSASRYELWKALDLIAAVGIAAYAFVLRGAAPSVSDVALGIVLFGSGVAAMYGLFIACAAASFWALRLDNLMYLLGAIFDAARWPIQVFRGAWRIVFTFVLPVAVMTTFPAMALLGRLDVATSAGTLAGSLALVAIGRLVWRAAIRSYTSASS